MKLAHFRWNNCLSWNLGEVGCLVLENPALFTSVIADITNQTEGYEGDVILSEENETINLAKLCLCVRDVFAMDLNNRRINNAILTQLKENAITDFILETKKVQSDLINLMENLVQTVRYPLEFDKELDVYTIVKLANIKCAKAGNLLEQILDFSLATQEFLQIKLMVFVGLKAYLSQSELLKLYDDWRFANIQVLLIEPYQRDILPNEKTLIIDNDLCEILLVDNNL